jgi:hypothetical protein
VEKSRPVHAGLLHTQLKKFLEHGTFIIMVQTTSNQAGITLLTELGYQKLSSELNFLRSTRRQEIAESLRDAAEDNDLAENDE